MSVWLCYYVEKVALENCNGPPTDKSTFPSNYRV